MSPPYMPFYVGDYLADTGHLSSAENGAYLLLIMHYWRTGSIPAGDEMRRRISRMTHREWSQSNTTIMSFFSPDGKHKRIDQELSRAKHKSSVLRDNALKSHDARRANANQKPLQTDCIAHTPSESEPEPEKNRDPDGSLVNDAVDAPVKDVKPKDDVKPALRLFGERWNELAGSLRLPEIEEIKSGSTRERHALARLREIGPDPEAAIAGLMARIRGSPYLRGEVNGFRCSFDWIVNAANFQKIMEGNYEDRKVVSIVKR